MRTIKFRGLRTDGEGWCVGSLVNNLWTYSEHSMFPKGTPVCEIFTGEYDGDCWEDVVSQYGEVLHSVFPESVGQFTGMTDKNGKDIFDGDLLDRFGRVYRIGWYQSMFALFNGDEKIPSSYPIYEHEIVYFTKVGNIHEETEK